jgi:hypothetical protein
MTVVVTACHVDRNDYIPGCLSPNVFFTDVTPGTVFAISVALALCDESVTDPPSVTAPPFATTLIFEASTPPFKSAARTRLLSARFACLVAFALPSASGALLDWADVAFDSLVWGQALIDATTINALPANLTMLITFIARSSVREAR